eukprot:Nitzschia sp. Nitz4//scaffold34_size148208//138353//139549//NITZ4_002998-RA/size148208-processed-gene-0.26-mRNA-1//1//CDS//3329548849//1846//frame0
MCKAPESQKEQVPAQGTTWTKSLRSAMPSPPPVNRVDFEQLRREHLYNLPKFLEDWVVENLLRRKDARNMGIFLVGLNILSISLPFAIFLFYCEENKLLKSWQLASLGMTYTALHLAMFARSFILSLHYITHCSIFNLQYRFLDHVWKAGICNMFGIPLGLYYPHHVGMHHAEDNVAPLDMSSTMDYDRGSKWNHFKYMFRFVSIGSFELPYRLFGMGKYSLMIQAMCGCTTYYSGMYYLTWRFPVASIFVCWLPWAICQFGLMRGNFKEHIFVDPDDYGNNYKSAFTCINAPSNALTFNTGYHIEHHEEPGLPWYQLPELFLKNIEKHAANDSLVFSGIGSMEVGTLALNGQFDVLADHYLNVGQPKRTREELIAEFKRRMLPIHLNRDGTVKKRTE